MNVILLEKVGKLGTIGDKVTVKSGYGRNYLIPKGKAIFATNENVAVFEQRRAELEKIAAERKTEAETKAAALAAIGTLQIAANAGDEGKLFGSIGARDIAEAITAAGVKTSKSEIKLPQGALREIGEFDINVQIHAEVTQIVKVIVAAE